MKKRVTRFRFSLPILLASASVFAATVAGDDNPRVRYQNQLLTGNLSDADTKLCRERIGEDPTPSNAAAYDSCKVTRLFVADLLAKRDLAGAPPMFKAAYVNASEVKTIADAIKKK